MEKTNHTAKEFQASFGMFNLFKGLGIVAVLFFHSMSSFGGFQTGDESNIFSWICGIIFLIVASFVMPAFFVASGYGFRPMKQKSIKKKVSQLLLPYTIMAVVTVLMHFVLHYGAFHYLKGTIKESIKVVGGFILALPENLEIHGHLLYTCGIGWYLISLLGVMLLLNGLMKICSGKAWILVLISAILGLVCNYFNFYIWCIPQILTGVLFFYEGYYIKDNKLLFKKWDFKWTILLLISVAIVVAGFWYAGEIDNIAEGVWNLSILSVLADGILAFFAIYWLVRANDCKIAGISLIKKLGNNSLIIFIIHSIEMKSIPWYIFTEKWNGNWAVGCILLVVARSIVIYVMYVVFLLIHKNIWKKIKKSIKKSKKKNS